MELGFEGPAAVLRLVLWTPRLDKAGDSSRSMGPEPCEYLHLVCLSLGKVMRSPSADVVLNMGEGKGALLHPRVLAQVISFPYLTGPLSTRSPGSLRSPTEIPARAAVTYASGGWAVALR